MRIRITTADGATQTLRAMVDAAGDLTPAMDDIGEYLVARSQDHFEEEASPEGVPWKKSRRAVTKGGHTLTDTGKLKNTITHEAAATHVDIGPTMMYGRIHQLGGTIKPKTKRRLRFVVDGEDVFARQVTIPARPYIGVGLGDADEIAALIRDHIQGAG